MHQERFASSVLGAHYRRTILLRDWVLTLGFQWFIENDIQNFTQTHNVAMIMQ
jgi:hypothetical protein